MFITNVVVGDHILDRGFFSNLKEASDYAQETVRHKVWELGNGQFYYGNVEARVYEPKNLEASDYQDDFFFQAEDGIRDSTNVL